MIGLEAMSHGRPVVAFDVGGISDWLEHEVTGLLVPEQDVDGLAKALTRLLGDPDACQRMGQMAFSNFKSKFSFQDYLDQITSHLMGNNK
jgi:glycosyltransferase involved in cell wall biosynthesis